MYLCAGAVCHLFRFHIWLTYIPERKFFSFHVPEKGDLMMADHQTNGAYRPSQNDELRARNFELYEKWRRLGYATVDIPVGKEPEGPPPGKDA